MTTDFDPELLRFYSKSKLRELQKSTDLTMRQKYELIKATNPIDESTHEYKIVGNGFVVRKKPASRLSQSAQPKKDTPNDKPTEQPAESPNDPPKESPTNDPANDPPTSDPFKDLKKYLS